MMPDEANWNCTRQCAYSLCFCDDGRSVLTSTVDAPLAGSPLQTTGMSVSGHTTYSSSSSSSRPLRSVSKYVVASASRSPVVKPYISSHDVGTVCSFTFESAWYAVMTSTVGGALLPIVAESTVSNVLTIASSFAPDV